MKKRLFIVISILAVIIALLVIIIVSLHNNHIRSVYTKTSKVYFITDVLQLEDRYTENAIDEVRAVYPFVRDTSKGDYYFFDEKIVLCEDEGFQEFYLNDYYFAVVGLNGDVYLFYTPKNQLINTYKSVADFKEDYSLEFFDEHILL